MKLKNLLLVIGVCIFSLAANAQNEKPHFDIEKHHQQQADFFTKEMGLTDAERKAFIPVMQEYIHARFDLDKNVRNAARDLMEKTQKTSADYQRVIDMSLDATSKKAELQKTYFKKFGEVLPAEKLFKYSRAERKFMRLAVKHHHKKESK